MPENKTAYVYNKGDYKYVVANGKRVRKGEEIELTDAQLVDLSHQGFIFSPVDKRRNLPDGAKDLNDEKQNLDKESEDAPKE